MAYYVFTSLCMHLSSYGHQVYKPDGDRCLCSTHQYMSAHVSGCKTLWLFSPLRSKNPKLSVFRYVFVCIVLTRTAHRAQLTFHIMSTISMGLPSQMHHVFNELPETFPTELSVKDSLHQDIDERVTF